MKRPEVVESFKRLSSVEEQTKAVVESKGDDNMLWIRKVVQASRTDRVSDVAVEDKLADLGSIR